MEKRICVAAVGDNCMDCYDDLGQSFPGGNPVNVPVYEYRCVSVCVLLCSWHM